MSPSVGREDGSSCSILFKEYHSLSGRKFSVLIIMALLFLWGVLILWISSLSFIGVGRQKKNKKQETKYSLPGSQLYFHCSCLGPSKNAIFIEYMNEWNVSALSQNRCCKKQETCSRWTPIVTVHSKIKVTAWNFLSDSNTEKSRRPVQIIYYSPQANKQTINKINPSVLKNQRKTLYLKKILLKIRGDYKICLI